MRLLSTLNPGIRQYLVITGNYWAFTLTDGALRMLVVLHFHQLGYSPLDIALLFLFYEAFGVVTNLVGGWLGARLGLNTIMNTGLLLQVAALSMLSVPAEWLTVIWVMAAQALSGIAKDLNKMSAKSSIKLLVADDAQTTLYKWVAVLTGSKNALKGVGFFLGGLLLTWLGFQGSVAAMAVALLLIWVFSIISLRKNWGKAQNKPKFSQIFSKSRNINYLSAARLFLFGARDVWFVVALPVYLSTVFNWGHWLVGSFLASWVIGYGFVQSITPKLTGKSFTEKTSNHIPDGKSVFLWSALLAFTPLSIALGLHSSLFSTPVFLLGGLMVFGILFAVNSSLHSYLILCYSSRDGVSLDVGFYYMANAMGRLLGTLLSGWIFQRDGLAACLYFSFMFILFAALLSLLLPKISSNP